MGMKGTAVTGKAPAGVARRRPAALDAKKYGRLCADVVPKVIETDEEFDRFVAKLEFLTFKKESTPEGEALADLLVKLIQDYDDKVELPDLPPHQVIAHLMEQRGLRQADMLEIFGSRSVASAVVSGKRAPSKAHIKKLAEFFGVGAEVFM